MKKEYVKPEADYVEFFTEDITVLGDGNGFLDGDYGTGSGIPEGWD